MKASIAAIEDLYRRRYRTFPRVALARIYGVEPPFDGCDVSGSYGRAWPDRLGSHDPVEIAFTAAGRRYFADRAAGRDLAAFVRSKRVQQLRMEPPTQAFRDLRAAYPRPGAIRIDATPRLTFTETSATGRRFSVAVAGGCIVGQNLKPYASVF